MTSEVLYLAKSWDATLAAVAVMAYIGTRPMEEITMEEVDLEEGKIDITEARPIKGNEDIRFANGDSDMWILKFVPDFETMTRLLSLVAGTDRKVYLIANDRSAAGLIGKLFKFEVSGIENFHYYVECGEEVSRMCNDLKLNYYGETHSGDYLSALAAKEVLEATEMGRLELPDTDFFNSVFDASKVVRDEFDVYMLNFEGDMFVNEEEGIQLMTREQWNMAMDCTGENFLFEGVSKFIAAEDMTFGQANEVVETIREGNYNA